MRLHAGSAPGLIDATSLEAPGASGKAVGSAGALGAGVTGGGSALVATWPLGAACSGSGRVFIDEKRVLEQPAASNASSETATRPVFE